MQGQISEIKKYQTDHLILLIGSNPLPNYVAVYTLCPTGKLHLLHSNSTEKTAEKFFHQFGPARCPPENLRNLGADESNPQKVKQVIEAVLAGIPPNETIGLHYTGGTKVMSVYAYHTATNDKRPIIYSYLDAQNLEMVINEPQTGSDVRVFVGDTTQISVKELLDLHGIELSQVPKEQPRLNLGQEELVQLFQTLISTLQIYGQEWREWCDSQLRRAAEARERIIQENHNQPQQWQEIVTYSQKFKSDGKLKQVELPGSPNLLPVRQIFAAQFPQASPWSLGELGKFCGFPNSKDMKSFAKWLDGEWLEDYTLWALQQLIEKGYNLYRPGMDYKALKPEFQFDVAVTCGYQLFAFSCTTSTDKTICKSKLFEAYVRASEMGGDEAKAALVCCFKDADQLEAEMIREFKAETKIKVFGLNDLPDLKDRFKLWFDQIEAGQRRSQ